jgi:hypothetical protein
MNRRQRALAGRGGSARDSGTIILSAATAQAFNDSGPAPDGAPSVIFGRFMLPDMSEHPCQVTDLTLDGATFMTPQTPIGGLQIVAYLDVVGRVEAISADPVPGGFRVLFPMSGPKRDRLAARFEWMSNKSADNRRHARYEPKDSTSHITLPDGRVYACEVIDISVSGAGVKVDVMPSLGTFVMLGKMRGRIVRYLETGVAIEFVRPLDTAQLSEHVK